MGGLALLRLRMRYAAERGKDALQAPAGPQKN